MRIKVEKSSKVVFRGEALTQCKLEINMNSDDCVLGTVAGLGRCHETR